MTQEVQSDATTKWYQQIPNLPAIAEASDRKQKRKNRSQHQDQAILPRDLVDKLRVKAERIYTAQVEAFEKRMHDHIYTTFIIM